MPDDEENNVQAYPLRRVAAADFRRGFQPLVVTQIFARNVRLVFSPRTRAAA